MRSQTLFRAAALLLLALPFALPASAAPPAQMEIVVQKDKKTRYSGADYDDKSQDFQFTVRIKNKEVNRGFERLKATLLVVGKETTADVFQMLDRTESEFDLPVKGEHEFDGHPVMLEFDDNKYMKHGVKYEGYVVVVRDGKGEIVASKATKASWLKNLDKLETFPPKTKFSSKFIAYHGTPP
jgi:hypothetical protein